MERTLAADAFGRATVAQDGELWICTFDGATDTPSSLRTASIAVRDACDHDQQFTTTWLVDATPDLVAWLPWVPIGASSVVDRPPLGGPEGDITNGNAM